MDKLMAKRTAKVIDRPLVRPATPKRWPRRTNVCMLDKIANAPYREQKQPSHHPARSPVHNPTPERRVRAVITTTDANIHFPDMPAVAKPRFNSARLPG